MHKVSIINKGEKLIPTEIQIDGQKLDCVTDVEYFKFGVDEIPTFCFTVKGMSDICQINQANIQFSFTPKTIEDALNVIRHEIDNDEESKSAYLKDIEEIISDNDFFDTKQKAKILLERIFGEVKGGA